MRIEAFTVLPNSFIVTRKEFVFFDGAGREIGTGSGFADGVSLGMSKFALRPTESRHVEDIMDVMGTLVDPAPGSLGWATSLEFALRGEAITVTDGDGWPVEIVADLSDGGVEAPSLPRHQPVAWGLRRGDDTAIETGGHVWRTSMAHVIEAISLRNMCPGDEEAWAHAWRSGELGCGDDPDTWADAERTPVAWASTWPGGHQTVNFGDGEHVGLYPQDLTVATAWAAAHPEETEPAEEWSWK